MVQARQCTCGHVGLLHRDVQPAEHLADVGQRRRGERSGAKRKLTVSEAASGMTLPATPPSIRTADSPSRYAHPSMSTMRA